MPQTFVVAPGPTSSPAPAIAASGPVVDTLRALLDISILSPANGTTGGTAHRIKPTRYHWYASCYLVAITLAVVLLVSLRRAVACASHAWQRRSVRRRRVTGRAYKTRKRAPTRMANALGSIGQGYASLRGFPRWLYGPETYMDAAVTIVYCAALFFYALNNTTWVGGTQNAPNQMGVMLPLIILLITKNNPVSSLTGITYQKLCYLHRAASRACLVLSWVHTIGWIPDVWDAGHFSHAYIIWGLVAIFGFTGLWVTSFKYIRRVAFDFFIVSHILFTIAFLVGALFHWWRLGYWVIPSLGIWIVDKVIQVIRMIVINRLRPMPHCSALSESFEVVDHELVRLTVRRPIAWKAGQHFLLAAPTISSSTHERHPFSVANMPSSHGGDAIFLVRVHRGFTKKLFDHASAIGDGGIADERSDSPRAQKIRLDGPYGTTHSVAHCAAALFVAGGTGVTFVTSHLLALLDDVRDGRAATSAIRLVWHVRHRRHVRWLAPILEAVSAASASIRARRAADETAVPGLELDIDVYVTRTHVSDEPALGQGLAEVVLGLADAADGADGVDTPALQSGQTTPAGGNASGCSSDTLVWDPPRLNIKDGRGGTSDGDAAGHARRSGSRTRGELGGAPEDEAEPLLKPSVPARQPSGGAGAHHELGLLPAAAQLLTFHHGRADLSTILGDMVHAAEGRVNVSVRIVDTARHAMDGGERVEYYEETIG